jgi:ATP-dependent Lon protease
MTEQTHPVSPPAETLFPVLPLRDIVVFPHMIVPLFVGREKSIRALEDVMRDDKRILLVAQRDAADDDPLPDAIYTMGTLASVLQLLKLPDGTVKVLVEGNERAKIKGYTDRSEYIEAAAEITPVNIGDPGETEALARTVVSQFESYVKLNKKVPQEALATIAQIDDPAKLADTVAAHIAVKIGEKQELLEVLPVNERLERVYALMEGEISVLQVEKRIRSRVKRQMEKTQREYYLNEQMKAIQKELGDGEERDEVAELEARIAKTKLSKEARERALAEVKKLKHMSPMSAEATVVRNYLDWLLGIPWGTKTRIKTDIAFAESVLDKDHYGLEKVKERIVEYLAVQTRTNKLRGPILCLVGPPGVGKTSLGKSIARSTGREFVRMSLGGVRDEAEIRGHRRTYIGSMPGKVVQSMRKAKKVNPLFLLDEIDKMGMDFRGDPSSALLEVLDPEQNATFMDHYLEIEYDLSNVMFVTTANTLNIPPALMDRMEIIRIAGYTEDEKLEIAKRHLLPKLMENHGLKKTEFEIADEALLEMIRRYTREAGVRNLERELSKLARKVVKILLTTKKKKLTIDQGKSGGASGRGEVPLWRGRAGGPGRRRHRARLDGSRRGTADGGSRDDARQGQDDGHRQPARRDEGVDFGLLVLRALARGGVRHQAAAVRQEGHSRPCARGRHPEGRAVGRRRHDHGHRVGDDRHSGAQGRGDDGRDLAARPRAADRRAQGEAAGGPARRAVQGADPGGERQGPRRDPRQREVGARDHPGVARRRRAQACAGAPARADRVGRGGRGAGACRRPRRRPGCPRPGALIRETLARIAAGEAVTGLPSRLWGVKS